MNPVRFGVQSVEELFRNEHDKRLWVDLPRNIDKERWKRSEQKGK